MVTPNKLRILISEDDPIGRRILELFLKPYGECVSAGRGDEALELYFAETDGERPFDIVLLDQVMPGLHGLEVLQAIRTYEKEKGRRNPTPVIMLSGETDANTIVGSQDLGASAYILKPVEESVLLRELQRLQLIPDPDDQWE